MQNIRFIDLFAGLGGTRIGLEQALIEMKYNPICVFTSEIKEHAIKAYSCNFIDSKISGDITKIETSQIPDFDILLGGFPCQAFSSAGDRKGFADTRGTLFFEIERILINKKPKGFILENVEGLVNHDKGKTLETILKALQKIGYNVSYKIINASDVGVPQNRKRIYIVGCLNKYPNLENINKEHKILNDILERNKQCIKSNFVENLLSHYSINELQGKCIKDKRGGKNNIHSWDIELKGKVSIDQKKLLNKLLTERRKKEWAIKKGITWMDGMPLTLDEIYSFFCNDNDLFGTKYDKSYLYEMLEDLVDKKYLVYEYPKELITKVNDNGVLYTEREYDKTKERGYNIVSGKLSYEISEILDNNSVSPTIVATDVVKLAVIDANGLRRLTIKEGLRLFGYPDNYSLDMLSYNNAFDLLGNTVVVPVIKEVALRLLQCF